MMSGRKWEESGDLSMSVFCLVGVGAWSGQGPNTPSGQRRYGNEVAVFSSRFPSIIYALQVHLRFTMTQPDDDVRAMLEISNKAWDESTLKFAHIDQ